VGQGKLGYVHLRAMSSGDIADWARDYYPVFNREGLIIDVRNNGGGSTADHLLTALTHLKPEHRDVITMRFIEGYAAQEVAQMLGKTEGAIRTLQHRALERLRKEYDAAQKSAAKKIKR